MQFINLCDVFRTNVALLFSLMCLQAIVTALNKQKLCMQSPGIIVSVYHCKHSMSFTWNVSQFPNDYGSAGN